MEERCCFDSNFENDSCNNLIFSWSFIAILFMYLCSIKLDEIYLRIETKASIISTLICAAKLFFNRPDNIMMPCSVNAYGRYFVCLPLKLLLSFKVTFCDLKDNLATSS